MFLCKLFYLSALLLILVPLIISLPHPHHDVQKRSSFFDIDCKGVFNKSIFFRLDRICEDCYSLFREVELHSLCKKQCFTTEFFKGCLEALQLQDEVNAIKSYIKLVNGADPNLSNNWDVCSVLHVQAHRFVGSWLHFPCSHTQYTQQNTPKDF